MIAPRQSAGIVHVFIVRRDIEITADHHPLEYAFCFFQAIRQATVPFHLVLVGCRADRLSVRRINRDYAHVADIGCNDPRLIVFDLVAESDPHFARFFLRQDGDAVIRLLSVEN